MKTFTAKIGSKTVVAQCDSNLRPQAQWLLNLLSTDFSSDEKKLRDGFKLQVGWSILSLQEKSGKLVIHEPNYGGNPFTEWNDDITCTLTVQAQQNDILELLDVKEGVAALFQDKIVLAKGVLDEKRIYLHRTKDAIEAGASGWYIGPFPADKRRVTYEAIYVYELLQKRPALLQVLALPPEYMVMFNGDEIEGWGDGE